MTRKTSHLRELRHFLFCLVGFFFSSETVVPERIFFFLFWCITFSHGRCTGTSRVRHHFSELGRALSEVGIPKLDKKEKKSDIEKNEKNEKKKEKRKR